MELAVRHIAIKSQGYVQCSVCKQSLETAVWPHLCYSCPAIQNDFDNEGIQATGHLCLRAAEDLNKGTNIAFWTRGLVPLQLPDPLDMRYSFENSCRTERIEVTGCILGSDGSGGVHSKRYFTL